MTSQW